MTTGKTLLLVPAAVAGLLAAGATRAAEVAICYNYGCTTQATVSYAPAELGQVRSQFAEADTPLAERDAIARAVAWLYFYAGLQSPIWRDRGGNVDDEERSGRMDCIDHSTNTTAYLALMERHGWLKFHGVGERVRRGWLTGVHWGARIVERSTDEEWVVDSWFLDPGLPAAIYPLKAWLGGARPAGAEIFRLRQ